MSRKEGAAAAHLHRDASISVSAGSLMPSNVCVQAVLFVRDLDRGILGRGSHGLQQYEMLRRGTDALVNGILRVRRLLKQKRTADADGELLPHGLGPAGGCTPPSAERGKRCMADACARQVAWASLAPS